MTIVYKLTNENGQTYNKTQWGENVTHTTSGKGNLCGPGWLHAYTHPLLAVLLNPVHADFPNPQLWEAECEIEKNDHGLKIGTTKLITLHQVDLPLITVEQRIKFAILCAKEVYKDTEWNEWANKWLNGTDRAMAPANAAANAAIAAATAEAASNAAAKAAKAACVAAKAAKAYVDAAAHHAAAATAYVDAAADAAARATANAAAWAAAISAEIDLIKIAQIAMEN